MLELAVCSNHPTPNIHTQHSARLPMALCALPIMSLRSWHLQLCDFCFVDYVIKRIGLYLSLYFLCHVVIVRRILLYSGVILVQVSHKPSLIGSTPILHLESRTSQIQLSCLVTGIILKTFDAKQKKCELYCSQAWRFHLCSSVLSVKFTGRVKFGSIRIVSTSNSDGIVKRVNITKLPTYLVLTPEQRKIFGSGAGEYLNYQSMGLLLRMLHPEVNDIFLLSLVVVNMACSLEFCVSHGSLVKRLGRAFFVVSCEVEFFTNPSLAASTGVVSIALCWYYIVRSSTSITEIYWDNAFCRMCAIWLAMVFICWWLVVLVTTFVLFGTIVGLLHHVYYRPEAVSVTDDHGLFNLQWESYLGSIFQPTGNLSLWPVLPNQTSAEIGMELLIERLAVPNLWLQPIISSQYIHSLPVWEILWTLPGRLWQWKWYRMSVNFIR